MDLSREHPPPRAARLRVLDVALVGRRSLVRFGWRSLVRSGGRSGGGDNSRPRPPPAPFTCVATFPSPPCSVPGAPPPRTCPLLPPHPPPPRPPTRPAP